MFIGNNFLCGYPATVPLPLDLLPHENYNNGSLLYI